MTQEVSDMTKAQRLFATREHATPGLSVPLGVFLYRKDPLVTTRWLVDRDGRVRDFAEFRRGW